MRVYNVFMLVSALIIVALIFVLNVFEKKRYTEADIIVNRLVYSIKNYELCNGPFQAVYGVGSYEEYSGNIREEGEFCDGIPCGTWISYDPTGGLIDKFTILNSSIISQTTKKLMKVDTIIVLYEFEISVNDTVSVLEISMLIDPLFENSSNQLTNRFDSIAECVNRDTKNLDYELLILSYDDAVYDAKYSIERRYLRQLNRSVPIPVP